MSTWDKDSFRGNVGDAMLGSGGRRRDRGGGGEFDDEDWQSSAAVRRRLRHDEDEPGESLITSIVLESSTIASTMYVKVWIGDGEDW